MNNRYLVALLLAALALAAVGAGCGSSSKSKSSTISKADFLRKGNAVCSNGTKEINAAGSKIFVSKKKKPTRQQVLKFAKTVLLPSVESQVNGIRALGAPKGDEGKVKAILAAADQGIAKSKQDPVSLTKRGPGPFKKANTLAKAYGLKACGGGG
jgi:hypothetical protein